MDDVFAFGFQRTTAEESDQIPSFFQKDLQTLPKDIGLKHGTPYCGVTLANFWGFCSITHAVDSTTMIKCFMCYKHIVLKLWLRRGIFS